MINAKYYADMQGLSKQFMHQYSINIPEQFPHLPRVIVCGMWGSTLYVPLVQDLLAHHQIAVHLEACSSYTLPPFDVANTVVVCASHSGNTEETLACLDSALVQKAKLVVFASWWALLTQAQEKHMPLYQIPAGLQPRLSTGYFIVALLDLLAHLWYPVHVIQSAIVEAAKQLVASDESDTKLLAQVLLTATPIIYTCDVLKSMSTICKIKCNENSKTPAFAHYIPELNHNEMCGRLGHTMTPHFIIFTSHFTHPRNLRRIAVMTDLLQKEGYLVTIIAPKGDSLEAEALWIYQYMDYVTYFLAEAKGVDPETVPIVETFKALL